MKELNEFLFVFAEPKKQSCGIDLIGAEVGVRVEYTRQVDPLDAEFSAAVDSWKRYISKKHVNGRREENDPLALNLNIRISDDCGSSSDLRIYLGVENDEVSKYRNHFVSPVGFAQRTEYDVFKKWGQGFIWVAKSYSPSDATQSPDWSKSLRLRALFVHELGHVLGCDHKEGTSVTEEIAHILRFRDVEPSMADIDQAQVLFTSKYGIFDKWKGTISKNSPDLAPAFKRLLGRKPIESIQGWGKLRVTLGDRKGSEAFDLEIPPHGNISTFPGGFRLFRVAYCESNEGMATSCGLGNAGDVSGAVLFGTLKGLPARLEVNTNRAHLRVLYLDEGRWTPAYELVVPPTP